MPPASLTRLAFAALLLAGANPALGANTDARKPSEMPPPDPSFVMLEPLDVPIVDGGRIDGVLHISLVLKAKTADDAAVLTKRMPELRAASLPVAIEFARLYASRFSAVDVRRLSGMITPPLMRVDSSIDKVLIVKVSAAQS